jgi:3-phenylpropionate/cinnamic acid dioxygenase small subunit
LTPADFLYHETALLDERRFEEWLELFTDDALYWIPQGDEADPSRHVSLVYDDRRRLHERVLRLTSGFAYSQDPPSKTCHLVGNVQVANGSDGDVEVSSTLLVAEVRRNAQNLFAGRVTHTLVREGDGFRIRRKTVRLVNSDIPLGNVTFLF